MSGISVRNNNPVALITDWCNSLGLLTSVEVLDAAKCIFTDQYASANADTLCKDLEKKSEIFQTCVSTVLNADSLVYLPIITRGEEIAKRLKQYCYSSSITPMANAFLNDCSKPERYDSCKRVEALGKEHPINNKLSGYGDKVRVCFNDFFKNITNYLDYLLKEDSQEATINRILYND